MWVNLEYPVFLRLLQGWTDSHQPMCHCWAVPEAGGRGPMSQQEHSSWARTWFAIDVGVLALDWFFIFLDLTMTNVEEDTDAVLPQVTAQKLSVHKELDWLFHVVPWFSFHGVQIAIKCLRHFFLSIPSDAWHCQAGNNYFRCILSCHWLQDKDEDSKRRGFECFEWSENR